MDKNTKKILIVALVFVILFASVFLIGKMIGKKGDDDQAANVNDIPGAKALSEKEKLQIEIIADELTHEMDGLNWSRELKPYENLNSLSDTLFVAVYNFWNQKYQQKQNMTLRQRINDEEHSIYWGSAFNSLWKVLDARFSRLNLK